MPTYLFKIFVYHFSSANGSQSSSYNKWTVAVLKKNWRRGALEEEKPEAV